MLDKFQLGRKQLCINVSKMELKVKKMTGVLLLSEQIFRIVSPGASSIHYPLQKNGILRHLLCQAASKGFQERAKT